MQAAFQKHAAGEEPLMFQDPTTVQDPMRLQGIFARDDNFRKRVMEQYEVCRSLEEQIRATSDVSTIERLAQEWKRSHDAYRNIFAEALERRSAPTPQHRTTYNILIVWAIVVGLIAMSAGQVHLAWKLQHASVAWKLQSVDAQLVFAYTGVALLLSGWFLCAFGSRHCLSPAQRSCWRRRFLTTWTVTFCTIPLVYMLDDLRRPAEETVERIQHVIPAVYPVLIYVYLILGAIHGSMPVGSEKLANLLALQTSLNTARCVNIAFMSGLWRESVHTGAIIILPTNLGFHAARFFIGPQEAWHQDDAAETKRTKTSPGL
jgi:hypothetical protein